MVINILKGIIIGIGIVVPGVSGSVIAIFLGVYDKMINIISNLKKELLKNKYFVISLAIGIIIGINIFGNILIYLLNWNKTLICYIFSVFILCGIPTLKNEIKQKNDKINIKILLTTLIISFILFLADKCNFNLINNTNNLLMFFNLFLGGFLYASGKIIPGVSSSFFMMVLGIYDLILKLMVSPLSFSVNEYIRLIPFFLGVLIGIIVISKILCYLLSKYFVETYSGIMGFVVGSVFAIIPEFNILYSLISIICIYLYYKIVK